MNKLLAIFIGGGIGALLRYGTALVAAKYFGTRFPWGTFVANMTGCFLIGIVFSLAERTLWISPLFRLFLLTGFLGALTTFSSYGLETVNAAQKGMPFIALVNILLNNCCGLILVFTGIQVIHLLMYWKT